MAKPHTEVTVEALPDCDIHRFLKGGAQVKATYDGKTLKGPWANMCEECFKEWGIGLGLGIGQRLVLAE